MNWLKGLFGRKEAPAADSPSGNCSVCGLSQIRIKDKHLIACPGGQFLCLSCVDKLSGTFGAGAGTGFTDAIEGACGFCGRSGYHRPPVTRTRTGLLCKECVRLVSQLAYERKSLPADEYTRRRKLWKGGLCYFCGKDKASVRGQGHALMCKACLDALAHTGTCGTIQEEVRCDMCMQPLQNGQGQMGIAGGYVCAECLDKHKQGTEPRP